MCPKLVRGAGSQRWNIPSFPLRCPLAMATARDGLSSDASDLVDSDEGQVCPAKTTRRLGRLVRRAEAEAGAGACAGLVRTIPSKGHASPARSPPVVAKDMPPGDPKSESGECCHGVSKRKGKGKAKTIARIRKASVCAGRRALHRAGSQAKESSSSGHWSGDGRYGSNGSSSSLSGPRERSKKRPRIRDEYRAHPGAAEATGAKARRSSRRERGHAGAAAAFSVATGSHSGRPVSCDRTQTATVDESHPSDAGSDDDDSDVNVLHDSDCVVRRVKTVLAPPACHRSRINEAGEGSERDAQRVQSCLSAAALSSLDAGVRRPFLVRSAAVTVESAEEADDLRDTDSEENESGCVSGEGGGVDRDGPVLCRCGARNWQDGARWICCDSRGCRTWEHLKCAYPPRFESESEESAYSTPPTHLCSMCMAKHATSFPARRRLERQGSQCPPSPMNLMSHALEGVGNDVETPVRRSRRVARRRGSLPQLRRKNVIGYESSQPSSCSDADADAESAALGAVLSDGYEDLSDDDFMAPEGQVETTRNYRCRCGATQGDQDDTGGAVRSVGESGPWVKCRSDSCELWEHAACCEYGCSDATSRKHWCRTCDPSGLKHDRSAMKRQTREKLRAQAESMQKSGVTAARGPGSPKEKHNEPATEVRAADERLRIVRDHLWTAVAVGDEATVEKVLLDAKSQKAGSANVEQLMDAEKPDGRHGSLPHGQSASSSQDVAESVTRARLSGMTVLMLAAGRSALREGGNLAPAAEGMMVSAAEKARSSVDGIPGREARSALDLTGNDAQTPGVNMVAEPAQYGDTAAGDLQGAAAPTSQGGCRQLVAVGTTFGVTGKRLAVLQMVLAHSGSGALLVADDNGRTAVHHAAATGATEGIRLLLNRGESGGKAALTQDHEGSTPLHVAAVAGHPSTCSSILGSLSPDDRAAVLAATDAAGENAFHSACAEGEPSCAAMLLEQEKVLGSLLASSLAPMVLARTTHGTTPLMAAAGCPSLACVELVLENYRGRWPGQAGRQLEALRATDNGGMSALHWAAGREKDGSVAVARALLEAEKLLTATRFPLCMRHRSPADSGWGPDSMIRSGDSENGASPLHLAAAVSHTEMVSLLLGEGADSVMRDHQGWTPVMYADFSGRKEGAILTLLQHEPEKQLKALGQVLSSREDRHHPRVVEVVRNLVTVPAFFALVNGFVRENPGCLLTTLVFLRDEAGLLDFENKRNLLRTLLASPHSFGDTATPSPDSLAFSSSDRIDIRRGPGEALSALLRWMENAARRWGDSGLAAFLRIRGPRFHFLGEAGYGPGVDREAWEMISEDLVLQPAMAQQPPPAAATSPSTSYDASRSAAPAAGAPTFGCAVSGQGAADDRVAKQSYFVPVDRGMSSYCPRDLRGHSHGGAEGSGWREQEEDLRAFELLGVAIGANLTKDKVLNLNLNPVVWKTILSRKVKMADLALVDEVYFRSLKQVLGTQRSDQLGLSFEGINLTYCQDGGDVDPNEDITDANKERYAALVVESRTYGRWRAQLHAFARGLRRLVPLRLLKMFTENELGLLLAGPGDIDVDDWHRHTKFAGSAPDYLRRWFWGVVRDLTREERSLLLQFATGCSRLPAGGFSGLLRPFTIAMLDYDPKRPLPMAATCFFMLKLPQYPEEYLLRKYLLVAIRHGAAGFELS